MRMIDTFHKMIWGQEDTPDTPGPAEMRALGEPGSALHSAISMSSSASLTGVSVTENTALQLTSVYCAVRVLADSVAQLPLQLFRKSEENGRSRVESPISRLLSRNPNRYQSASVFKECIQGWLGLWGNAFAMIERDRKNQPIALWPRSPRTWRAQINEEGDVEYFNDQSNKIVPYLEMLHWQAFGDGINGFSPIALHRSAIGLGMATEQYGSAHFGNSGKPAGVLMHPEHLTEEAENRLRNQFDSHHRGVANAGKPLVLEEGMSWASIGIPPDDAQFLQTREFQVAEIARIYRVPPHMLYDLTRATFSNIEEMQLAFYTDSLLPWLNKWEEELNAKLLPPHGNQFFKFNADAFLRGDIETRFNHYKVGREASVYTINEMRRFENLPEIGPEGDTIIVPLNFKVLGEEEPELVPVGMQMVPSKPPSEPEEEEPDEEDEEEEENSAPPINLDSRSSRRTLDERRGPHLEMIQSSITDAIHGVMDIAVQRSTSKLVKTAAAMVDKGGDQEAFRSWARGYLSGEMTDKTERLFESNVRTMAASIGLEANGYARKMARALSGLVERSVAESLTCRSTEIQERVSHVDTKDLAERAVTHYYEDHSIVIVDGSA